MLCCALLYLLVFRTDSPLSSTMSGDITVWQYYYNQLLVSVLYSTNCDTSTYGNIERLVYRYTHSRPIKLHEEGDRSSLEYLTVCLQHASCKTRILTQLKTL
jgi:hypothetical protein